ncbi:NCS1 family nucleobase:cation symporter-1 [Scopulibacillus darangshiensis]|uniref:NCS1 family nucleobase:cation symporter-1 n=1 Tax=Scopulibacillus darangshiensis TaxID=442528 RepID=A0A4R2NHN1_9BACL|nr:cytosine permease [Scopulibacillus darangshiensis]TCP20768.1 NCS1 family nucleobase:cation symporter-1 [Scopulibacillus darangshiensis]
MKIEKYSIDHIPKNERHGSPKSLFTIWFGINMQIVAIVMGALAVVLGLNLFWSIIAIVIGNLVGAIFMAYHSAQGPKLGIPQMIQSRAQFGVIGAILPLILVLIMYIGFSSTGAVLNAQAVVDIVPMPLTLAIVICHCITFAIAVYGYDLIHAINRYLSIVFTVVFLIITFLALKMPLPAHSLAISQFEAPSFLLVVSIVATWQLVYAPYVADYSRYLPENTSTRKTFAYTYFGTVISCIWMMSLGALLAILIPDFSDNPTVGLSMLVGPQFSIVIDLLIILGGIAAGPLTFYGAFMSVIATLEPFTKLRGTPKVRFWLMFIIVVVCTVIPICVQSYFLDFFSNFMNLLMYSMVPWTAINLVDFYFLRKSKYNISDIFDVNGQYGRYNWIAIFSYIVGVLVEIPFVNTTLFEGAIAKALGGADVAWIVGLIVPSLLYYYPMRRTLNKPKTTIHNVES